MLIVHPLEKSLFCRYFPDCVSTTGKLHLRGLHCCSQKIHHIFSYAHHIFGQLIYPIGKFFFLRFTSWRSILSMYNWSPVPFDFLLHPFCSSLCSLENHSFHQQLSQSTISMQGETCNGAIGACYISLWCIFLYKYCSSIIYPPWCLSFQASIEVPYKVFM